MGVVVSVNWCCASLLDLSCKAESKRVEDVVMAVAAAAAEAVGRREQRAREQLEITCRTRGHVARWPLPPLGAWGEVGWGCLDSKGGRLGE